mmetsp:Transcript_26083/g.43069  ORF Transcript_26083/g.43069 Transcript_26083/m.43069 type:complete len:370 (+) Transcript_26083:106-1215(+)
MVDFSYVDIEALLNPDTLGITARCSPRRKMIAAMVAVRAATTLQRLSARNQRLRSDLTGELFKKSSRLPFYQKCKCRLLANTFWLGAVALPIHTLRNVEITDDDRYEFALQTSDHTFQLRVADSHSEFRQWVGGLEMLIERNNSQLAAQHYVVHIDDGHQQHADSGANGPKAGEPLLECTDFASHSNSTPSSNSCSYDEGLCRCEIGAKLNGQKEAAAGCPACANCNGLQGISSLNSAGHLIDVLNKRAVAWPTSGGEAELAPMSVLLIRLRQRCKWCSCVYLSCLHQYLPCGASAHRGWPSSRGRVGHRMLILFVAVVFLCNRLPPGRQITMRYRDRIPYLFQRRPQSNFSSKIRSTQAENASAKADM